MFKIGVIGTGMIAEKHLMGIEKEDRTEATWLGGLKEEKLKRIQEKYSVPNATTDYRQLINANDVDAVLICTPPFLHKKMFIESLNAGKHVFVEKPAAMNLEEIDEMIAAKNRFADRMVCDCSARHTRLQPKYKIVKEIIESGALGEIYYIHHNSTGRNGRPGIEYHPDAKWFLNKAEAGGGALFDWGVYDLSFHLGILNDEPVLKSINDVFLKSGLDDYNPGEHIYDVEEMFAASLSFSEGIRFYWERGSHANIEAPNETRIYGTRGGLKLGFCSWDSPEINIYDHDDNGKSRHKVISVDMEGHSDDEALIVHFADILERKTKPAMPLELAKKHLEIIFKCYEAGK